MLQDATHVFVQRSVQLELELRSVRNSLCLEMSDAANRDLLLHRAQSQLEMEREFGMKAMAEAISLLTKVQHLGQELVIIRSELSTIKVGLHLAEIGLFGILCLLITLACKLLIWTLVPALCLHVMAEQCSMLPFMFDVSVAPSPFQASAQFACLLKPDYIKFV